MTKASKGKIAIGADQASMIFAGEKWLRLTRIGGGNGQWLVKREDEVLEARLIEIDSVFKLCEELLIEGTGLIDLNDLAREYNQIEEELINRQSKKVGSENSG